MSPVPSSPSPPEGSIENSRTLSDPVSPPRVSNDTKTIIGNEAITGGDNPPVASQVGETIGKYEIRSQLGAGGMGAVLLAYDSVIEREVAIKVLSEDVAASKVALQRFLQEARAIGRLNHPNVVSIYDIDQWNGQYFIVMELLSGGSLAELVEKRGPLPWQEACHLIAQAAQGLAAAHAAGMVHRDIKPENLMQTKEGLVKVVDFGLSKLVDAANDTRTAVTKQGQILGTPQYMSPEQFESTEVDLRTDVYSLGASLFRLLTGRFAYHESVSIVQTMMAHLNKPIPKATDFNSQLPAECDLIIERAMAKRPIDRYQHASDMAEDLIGLIQSQGSVRTGVSQATSPLRAHSDINRAATVVADRIAEEVIPLKSVMIFEPSKMVSVMLKDAVIRAGATRVNVVSSRSEVMALIHVQPPDLLITAMQLPDGLATDMIKDICQKASLASTTLVLNSSDSSMDELNAAGIIASRVLAPKKVRPDDILRVVHAAGPVAIGQGPIAAPLDPLNLRLVVLTDFEKAPDALADLSRQVGLLDVTVLRINDVASIPTDDIPTVVLRLPTTSSVVRDPDFHAKLPTALPDARHLLAEIEVKGNGFSVRAICRQGVVASISHILDVRRLNCLLQACRLS